MIRPTPDVGQEWHQPGVFEVGGGIYRVPLPLTGDVLRAVNIYVIAEASEVTLIDAGWAIAAARMQIETSLHTLGIGLSDITRFLVTHIHRDHYTLGVALRREFGGRLSLGRHEKPVMDVFLSGRSPIAGQLEQMQRCGAGALVPAIRDDSMMSRPIAAGTWEAPDIWLPEGELRLASGRALNVVETPGHTRGHVVYHDHAAGLLFAGDHVLPQITPSLGLEAILSPSPLGDYLSSLARVRAMPDAVLLPAHGPVAPSVHARVDELLSHHDVRLDQTERALAAGVTTAYEAAGQLRWTRRERTLDELNLFNQMLAISETHAHLVVLTAQGRATAKTDADGVMHFTAA
jgi:glyoxylase-like metal-dependent hydrolase (beta-lactamase superfamily II)